MKWMMLLALAAMVTLGYTGPAAAELCQACKGKMYIQSIGVCTSCGGHTTSGAFKLCPKCSAKQGKCEHCLVALASDAKSAPEKKPGEPPKIDMGKSGKYTHGKWEYSLTVRAPGGPREGREGRLRYDGKELPRGDQGDYYDTPWGRMTWLPIRASLVGSNGWIPMPPDAKPRGKQLTPPGAQEPKPPAEKEPKLLELSDADNGKTIKVAVGRQVVIRLPGNPTTGYSWRTAKVTGEALTGGEKPEYVQRPHAPGMVGVGGTFVFTFKAIKPGKAQVRLEYARPWEKDKPPEKTFSVTVEARAE